MAASIALAPVAAATIVYDPPWADIFGGQWNNLDTRASAQIFADNFTNEYHEFVDQNRDATSALSTNYAGSDAIWIAHGHGVGGGMTFCNPPLGSTCTSVLWANPSTHNCSDPAGSACLSNPPTGITKMRLMAFVACDTGDDSDPSADHQGNIVREAVNGEGVTSAVGFTGMIYLPPSDYWTGRFAAHLSGGTNGEQLTSALFDATLDTYNHTGGNYGGMNNYFWRGFGGLTLKPAKYGS